LNQSPRHALQLLPAHVKCLGVGAGFTNVTQRHDASFLHIPSFRSTATGDARSPAAAINHTRPYLLKRCLCSSSLRQKQRWWLRRLRHRPGRTPDRPSVLDRRRRARHCVRWHLVKESAAAVVRVCMRVVDVHRRKRLRAGTNIRRVNMSLLRSHCHITQAPLIPLPPPRPSGLRREGGGDAHVMVDLRLSAGVRGSDDGMRGSSAERAPVAGVP